MKYSDDREYCVICLEYINLAQNNKIMILICDHIFHKKCITKYFKINKYNKAKCPLCKELIHESFNEIDDYAYDIYDKLEK